MRRGWLDGVHQGAGQGGLRAREAKPAVGQPHSSAGSQRAVSIAAFNRGGGQFVDCFQNGGFIVRVGNRVVSGRDPFALLEAPPLGLPVADGLMDPRTGAGAAIEVRLVLGVLVRAAARCGPCNASQCKGACSSDWRSGRPWRQSQLAPSSSAASARQIAAPARSSASSAGVVISGRRCTRPRVAGGVGSGWLCNWASIHCHRLSSRPCKFQFGAQLR